MGKVRYDTVCSLTDMINKKGIWTMNDLREDINDLIDKKVDILIGNYPDLVKK